MIKTDESLDISAESQLICTKPSEQGSFFWISRNESKECYTTIKSDENSNISAEFQQFQQNLNISVESWPICTKPSEQGSDFSEPVNMSPRSAMLWSANWWKLKYLSRILIDMANFAKKVA